MSEKEMSRKDIGMLGFEIVAYVCRRALCKNDL